MKHGGALASSAMALLATAACSAGLHIRGDTSLSGALLTSALYVEPGLTVTVPADLNVTAVGDVRVDGDLIAPDGSGASITLVSTTGRVVINGRIQAGSGAPGTRKSGVPEALAGARGPGGSVGIEGRGSRVDIGARLTGGTGGTGGEAFAISTGPVSRAVSGGGAGGSIRITAATTLELRPGAQIEAGAGGPGGKARAWILVAEVPAQVADAYSASGGPGGDIELRIAPTGTAIQAVGIPVRSGPGGDSAPAEAQIDGAHGIAAADPGGRGGNVRLSAGSALRILVTQVELGRGGHSGEQPTTTQADASAARDAVARVHGGGQPGALYEDGVKLRDGVGGNSGRSAAFTPGCTRPPDVGSQGSPGVRGRPTAAACP